MPYQINYIIHLAVPCFFVISGYLITASAIKNDVITYLKKRVGRIYPAYLLSVIATVALFAPIVFTITNGGNFDLNTYLTQTPTPFSYMIHSYRLTSTIPIIGTTLNKIPSECWNGSAWTLQFEFGCYIAIMLIIIILNKIKIKSENYPKLIFGLYVFLIIISIFYPKYDGMGVSGINMLIIAVYFFSIFLGGSIVYLIKEKISFSYKYLSLSLIFCIIIMTILPNYWAMEICAIPMVYIILFLSIKIKSPKWIQKNDISYGIYIYAWPIQTVIACFLIINSININIYLYMIICMIATGGFATLSWFLVEKPILNKVR